MNAKLVAFGAILAGFFKNLAEMRDLDAKQMSLA